MLQLLNKPSSTPACIHEILVSIEDNTRKISTLTKKKQKNAEKISATLDFLRLSKKYLSETQIESFVKFSTVSEASSHILPGITKQLDTLESTIISTAKGALIHTDNDPDHDKLSILISLQQFTLSCLENVIISGDMFLQNLEYID